MERPRRQPEVLVVGRHQAPRFEGFNLFLAMTVFRSQLPRPSILAALLFSLIPLPVHASEAASPVQFFEQRVQPLLANNCWACHTASALGGLRLDSRDSLLQGGSRGPAVVPGDPDASLLIRAVNHSDETLKMPPANKLAETEIAVLRTWIEQGAHWAEDSSEKKAQSTDEFDIRPEQRAFWSFQPLQETEKPSVRDQAWPQSELDYYILAALEARGLEPVRSSSKRTLVRRAYFDLTGLPPDPKEVEALVADDSPEAFAVLVDRLLASPRFGERWGRYWLDVARYGDDDSTGPGRRGYSNAWRYRDWVIAAFNQDMPYDLFVKAQIAGDLFEDESAVDLKPALGFFALGPWPYDIAPPPVQRANERDIFIDGLTRGFLGLTVACARCHDHKYDPISTKDYYALGGVFASSAYEELPLVPEEIVEAAKAHSTRARELKKEKEEFLKKFSDQLGAIFTRQIGRYMIAAWKVSAEGTDADALAKEEQLNAELLRRWVDYLGKKKRDHPYLKPWDDLLARKGDEEEIKKAAEDYQSFILSVIEEKEKIDEQNERILARVPKRSTKQIGPNGYAGFDCKICDFAGESIERNKFVAWQELLGEQSPSFEINYYDSGILVFEDEELEPFMHQEFRDHLSRLDAETEAHKENEPEPYPYLMMITEAEKPVNLKVNLRGNAMNLGEEVPRRFLEVLSDGEPQGFSEGSGRLELAEQIVSHPLTARVMANRVWQRLFGQGIVRTASNFGQLGDRPSHPELLDYLAGRLRDGNWSIKSLIREIMLSATYQASSAHSDENLKLDPENRYFWRARPRRLDVEALRDSLLSVSGNLDLTAGGPAADLDSENRRRTVYGKVSRADLDVKLALFDFPSPDHSSEGRTVTNIPLQRLFFLNSDLILAESKALAERLEREAGSGEEAKLRRAYHLLYGREATAAEIQAGTEFVASFRPAGSSDPAEGWRQYAQVLLSANEFLYLD